MKSVKILFFSFLLVAFIAPNVVKAQALVEKDDAWYFMGYVSYDAHEVISPSGTVNLRVNFWFDLTDPMIVEAIANGPYKIEVPVLGHIDGMYYNFVAVGTVYPNGRVKLNGHAKHYF